ncbi:MAG: hypothetical protein ACRC1K_19780 [Planctomycetia bacterium]
MFRVSTGRWIAFVMAAFCVCGCKTLDKFSGAADCSADDVVKVKIPPQKIIVESEDYDDAQPCPAREKSTGPGQEEYHELEVEAAPAPPRRVDSRRESASRPAERRGGAEAAGGREFSPVAVGAGIAAVQQLSAVTQPLTQQNPGGTALGIGVSYLRLSIPIPRLFTVQEAPSVTIPLTAANLTVPGLDPRLMAGGQTGAGQGQRLSEQDVAQVVRAAIDDEMRRKRAAEEDETARAAVNAEKAQLSKELKEANDRVLRLTAAVESIQKETAATRKATREAVDAVAPTGESSRQK